MGADSTARHLEGLSEEQRWAACLQKHRKGERGRRKKRREKEDARDKGLKRGERGGSQLSERKNWFSPSVTP